VWILKDLNARRETGHKGLYMCTCLVKRKEWLLGDICKQYVSTAIIIRVLVRKITPHKWTL
jgi:hypothetical protein